MSSDSDDQAVRRQFFRAVTTLAERGAAIQHSAEEGLLAYSLDEVASRAGRAAIPFPERAALARALPGAIKPTYLSVLDVKSRWTGKTVRCWVFRVR